MSTIIPATLFQPQNSASQRALDLLATLQNINQEDLDGVDAVINELETRLNSLRAFRKLVAVMVAPAEQKPRGKPGRKLLKVDATVSSTPTAPTTLSAPSPPATPDSERAARLSELRRKVVYHIAKLNKPVGARELMRVIGISGAWINEVLNHPWFDSSPQGVHIMPLARSDLLES